MSILRSILNILFGSLTIYGFTITALETVGLWGIFRKCGQQPWKALIPFYKDYALAECAGRQPEGIHVFVLQILLGVSTLSDEVLVDGSTLHLVLVFATVAMTLDLYINLVKIWLGLIEVYDRRKRGVILFMLPTICLMYCLYGWHRAFQPQWKLHDFRENEANFFSGVHAQALDNGLAVNINARSVRNLFEKKYLLRDIHMYIKPGTMVLLLGGSGAGKTTFLNAVIGL